MHKMETRMMANKKAADTMISTDRCGPRFCTKNHHKYNKTKVKFTN